VAVDSPDWISSVQGKPWPSPLRTYSFSAVNALVLNAGNGQTKSCLYLYHPATVAETVKIRRVLFAIVANTAACTLTMRFGRFTIDPGIAGGAAQIVNADSSDAAINAADEFCASPSNAVGVVGTATAMITVAWAIGVSAPPTDVTKLLPFEVYNWKDSPDLKPPTILPNVAEGWGVTVDSGAVITNPTIACSVEFTVQ
jgi:hypothetical protein